jgi:hypothetical protein
MSYTYDPRDIPVLTEVVDLALSAPTPSEAPAPQADNRAPQLDATALQAAIVEDTLKLADSLTSQAAREIESLLYDRVFGQLRAQLPDLVAQLIRQQLPGEPEDAGEPDG